MPQPQDKANDRKTCWDCAHFPDKTKDNSATYCKFWFGCTYADDDACERFFEPKQPNDETNKNMEPEINASDYPTPAKLAFAINREISQLYVDCVWINFPTSRQKITPTSADNVCKGLLMASAMIADQENGE